MKDNKSIYTGTIEKNENGNFFCGKYLLDYQYKRVNFKIRDEINIKKCYGQS